MHDWITPDWPAPPNVKALFTTRSGGVSRDSNGAYASMNLGAHVHDELTNVLQNRALLCRHLPSEPQWLKQVHGVAPVAIDHTIESYPTGDAAFSHCSGTVCAVMVADCLPVLLCDSAGTAVGVAHAGWRGLSEGIIETTIAAMQVAPRNLIAWLGPAIGPQHFEVGTDVYEAFVRYDKDAAEAFTAKNKPHESKWLADIFQLARQRLQRSGIHAVYGGGICTYSNPQRFFSYRRDGETGRMAALIWLA